MNQENQGSPLATQQNYYKPFAKRGKGPWDAIVIGSGMGGMVCAASLAKYGRRVLVLEQHYIPGGFTHTFSRKGYTWDVGVHCVGQMEEYQVPGRIIRWLSDGKIKMASMGDVYETFHYPEGFSITFPDSRAGFRESLIKAFPNEVAVIDEYLRIVKTVEKTSKSFFAGKAMPVWMDRLTSRFIKSKSKWWKLTTKSVLDGLTSNEKLKAVLTSQWGYYGSTPSKSSFAMHALTACHFWSGGYYPVGGSQVFADHFLRVVAEAGGETLVRADVAEVIIEKGRAIGVRMRSGEEFFAPLVISAAGAKLTASKLIPEKHKTGPWVSQLESMNQSPPHVCLYIGFEGDIVSAGATKSNQWFMESWNQELPNWDVSDLNSEAPILYMSFPSLKDPLHEQGPQAKHTGEVVTFVPWEAFEKWKDTRRGLRDPEYMEFKKSIEDRLIKQLNRHIPKLMSMVKYVELSTPLSTTHFTRAPMGAIYGLEATPERFTSPHIRTRTPFKGLYLAGGDVATLGVTGAMVGGILAAGSIEPRVLTKLV